ncbi:hypothetical protein EMCG_03456 [[Emmonsia] crescens]|uniref:CFEM domain-containing protein n=1 Tax=[Emmonsia] crescens TaxID=73230 RepID=A0A0G2HW57_9EURO|nr:hypothetical protein EMCG_03456 [Emmonsia crescens UAMH 3008]
MSILQKSCIMDTAGRAQEFGCSNGDVVCLCQNKDYERELMNCAKKCKPEEIDAMTKAGREVCASAGGSVPPATEADITIPVPTVEVPSVTMPPLPELPSMTMPPLPELPSVPPLPPLPSLPGLPPNAGAQGTATSNPISMTILPVSSSGVTYLDPNLSTSAAASSSSIEPFIGAANLLSSVHTGAIYIGLLALVL